MKVLTGGLTILVSALYLSPLAASLFDLTMWMFSFSARAMGADRYGPAIIWTVLGFFPWVWCVCVIGEFD